MKAADLSGFSFFVLLVLGSSAPALAGCASAMTPSKALLQPLPTACKAMGPLHLGMRSVSLIKRFGIPNLETTYEGVREMVYVFPRGLAKRLQEQPEPESYLQQNLGYIRVTLISDKVVTIDSFSQSAKSIPYSVGGIVIGADIYPLLRSMKIKASWNNSKDSIFFLPYPLEVSINPTSHKVSGITISSGSPIFGPMPITHLIKQKGSDLVYSFSISFDTEKPSGAALKPILP